MATYEYQCLACETKLSVTRSISDPDPGYFCESCGNRLNRVYSMSNPVFKGSGFYRTDK
jgi:putative FmdB family regulatory protein